MYSPTRVASNLLNASASSLNLGLLGILLGIPNSLNLLISDKNCLASSLDVAIPLYRSVNIFSAYSVLSFSSKSKEV